MPDVPDEVGRSVTRYLAAVDERAPGLVTGFYLVGSVALGDFHATTSDIDFVAVTDRHPAPELASVPRFDGRLVTWTDLASGAGVNPVTLCELAWHGIAIRGPRPAELDLPADANALRAYTRNNLNAYWRSWWRRHSRLRPRPFAVGLSTWFPMWSVLGVSRLHHLLATGTMTSKCGAGRYAQRVFEPRWQPIIAESLWLRTSGVEGRRSYRNPLARRRDTLAFLDAAIEDALALRA